MAQEIIDTVDLETAAPATIGQAAEDGARIIGVDEVDERRGTSSSSRPASASRGCACCSLDGYEEGATDAAWPTLYLLHGAWADYSSWTVEGHAEMSRSSVTCSWSAPDGGQWGWYSDWSNDGNGGQPAWETFHTVELPQLIEANWGGGPDRAVAGLSMGGFGALTYAARHPGMFKAAASYSGVTDTLGSGFETESLMWGDKTDDLATWEAHNPASQAAALEGTDSAISVPHGRPGTVG